MVSGAVWIFCSVLPVSRKVVLLFNIPWIIGRVFSTSMTTVVFLSLELQPGIFYLYLYFFLISAEIRIHDFIFHCRTYIARERPAFMVLVASMSGYIVNTPQSHSTYAVSKAAVHHLTRSMAGDWVGHATRVNSISLGVMNT